MYQTKTKTKTKLTDKSKSQFKSVAADGKFSELVSGRADAARDGPVSANAISECTF